MANPHEFVSIGGKVVKEITEKEAEGHIDKPALKYADATYRRSNPSENRVILLMEPSKSSSWRKPT